MSTTTKGEVQSGFGALESAAGDAVGDRDLQARGGADRLQGDAKQALGSAQQAIGDVAGRLSDAASDVADQARQTYGAASARVQDVRERIEPFVQRKPYLALLSAFALGFAASRLLAPGGPKVVFVKPRG